MRRARSALRKVSGPSKCSCSCFLFAGCPAVTLMFVDHAHCLHESVANGRSHKFETFLLQILAHGIAVRCRDGNAAEIQRPAPDSPAVGELPEIIAEGCR